MPTRLEPSLLVFLLACAPCACSDGATTTSRAPRAPDDEPPAQDEDELPAKDEELPAPCEPLTAPSAEVLLDDFEDGDLTLSRADGLRGAWYATNDGSGEQVGPLSVMNDESEPASRALYTSGVGFEEWGAFVAARLNSARGRACTYDLSASTGLSLRVRGSGSVRVNVATTATTPLVDGGTCKDERCSDFGAAVELTPVWRELKLDFASLTQPDWARPTSFDASTVLRVSIWTEQEDFELWLDDLAFYGAGE